VYRSWIALRDAVDTGTAAPSPAAVADAAVAAGFDEEAVESLTREFCVLRYGPAEVTAESEARARTLAGTLGIAVSTDR
jgi:AICAR transformylase/IMP cyclohydrolase PurH